MNRYDYKTTIENRTIGMKHYVENFYKNTI